MAERKRITERVSRVEVRGLNRDPSNDNTLVPMSTIVLGTPDQEIEEEDFFSCMQGEGGEMSFKSEKDGDCSDLKAILTLHGERVDLDLVFAGYEGIGIVKLLTHFPYLEVGLDPNERIGSMVIEDSVVQQFEDYLDFAREKLKESHKRFLEQESRTKKKAEE